MIRKSHLLKYLKKKVSLGLLEKPRESERIVIKVTKEGAVKDPGTSGLAQNLNIVSFVGNDSEEKGKKYDKYTARR